MLWDVERDKLYVPFTAFPIAYACCRWLDCYACRSEICLLIERIRHIKCVR